MADITGKGTATEVKICGVIVRIGDYLKVKYTYGTWSKNGIVSGEVTALWDIIIYKVNYQIDGAFTIRTKL